LDTHTFSFGLKVNRKKNNIFILVQVSKEIFIQCSFKLCKKLKKLEAAAKYVIIKYKGKEVKNERIPLMTIDF
jgi:hypothetical protein